MPTLTFGNQTEYIRFDFVEPMDHESFGLSCEAVVTAAIGIYEVDHAGGSSSVWDTTLTKLLGGLEHAQSTLAGEIVFQTEYADVRGALRERGRLTWHVRIRRAHDRPDELYATIEDDQSSFERIVREVRALLRLRPYG